MKDSQWWDVSWNPVTGCTKISAGCEHCYAKSMHDRFFQSTPFEKVELHPERLSKIDNTKPKVVFADSASDLFHEDVPFEFISEVFSVMQRNPLHTFAVLTKRALRMAEYFIWVRDNNPEWRLFYPLENLWLGVTAENQDKADERIQLLLKTPAKHRFVSVEPMLGPVDLGDFLCWTYTHGGHTLGIYLDFVICGGESGPGARIMRPEWVRDLRNVCKEADVPFFFKQWGEWVPAENEFFMIRSRGMGVGRKLDGVEWNQLPWEKKTEKRIAKANLLEQLSLEVK